MLYNQIDYVGACVEVDGGNGLAFDFTFSDNVCGPGIGAGATTASDASHYIQVGGITGLTADNNAFLGPMDPKYEAAGLHNNVLHVFGIQSYRLLQQPLVAVHSRAGRRSCWSKAGSTT